jgi:hypothetical protein
MTIVYLFFALPALVAVFMVVHRLVEVQVSEPVEMVTLDRTAVVSRLLAKSGEL